MTDDIEAKALALMNELRAERGCLPRTMIYRDTDIEDEALCRAIEQHEAFKQEVSDAVKLWRDSIESDSLEVIDLAEQDLLGFIIPKPKPDPLVEVLNSLWGDSIFRFNDPEAGQLFRAALKAGGLEIVEKGQ